MTIGGRGGHPGDLPHPISMKAGRRALFYCTGPLGSSWATRDGLARGECGAGGLELLPSVVWRARRNGCPAHTRYEKEETTENVVCVGIALSSSATNSLWKHVKSGSGGMRIVSPRSFVGTDVRWIVKTRRRWSCGPGRTLEGGVKRGGFVDPGVWRKLGSGT